jgi:hypothetical protein
MNQRNHTPLSAVAVVTLLCGSALPAHEPPSATSESGRYRLTARSTDDTDRTLRSLLHGSFVYKLRDTKLQKDLWTRKQPEDEPVDLGEPGRPFIVRTWKERSPVSLFVDDDGWSVLWLGGDELIVVRRDGKETAKLKILDAFSQKERNHYVQFALDVGEYWGRRQCYFTTRQGSSYFVVRTWWGHRVILDLESGRLASDTGSLATVLDQADRTFVRTTLEAAVKEYQKRPTSDEVASAPVRMAIYMAGQMHMKECIPSLRLLEDCPYMGESALFEGEEPKEGELDYRIWEVFNVRQVVQLALRRLNELPKSLPSAQFRPYHEDHRLGKPFVPVLSKPRADLAASIHRGMQAIDVLRLLGSPDFNCGVLWEYEMDGRKPYTLLIEWDDKGAKSVVRKTPASWQNGDCRDLEIMR